MKGQDLVVIAREKLNAILASEIKPEGNSPE